MPMKKQAAKIKAAAKGSVKAKKVVSASGYGLGSSKKKSGYGCKPAKSVCKPAKSVAIKSSKKAKRKSAFRALSNQTQPITANTFTQVEFGQEQFDLGREYNPATSTFRAKLSGVYTFVTSVLFNTTPTAGTSVILFIMVNDRIAAVKTGNFTSGGFVDITTIVKLRSGDDVEVRILSEQPGEIIEGTARFEGVLNRVTK
ncbi:complement C1q domain-containing protein [Paenibacillus glycanilyticus]|uniref:complement C1q domain-containing protein n=1 Tax=Paenibacillus glycanilyticus TaxID=126569 RepID=UPI00203BAFD3|nr:complement C1q domain-containing protein [Paenibacillus glycanilyticus]MCM3625974.1 complement C1q domain-containing protein [Paenibacillus glycanilyticus]